MDELVEGFGCNSTMDNPLGNLVNGFLDRARVADQVGEGMIGDISGPNASAMGATMTEEGAANLGMFGSQSTGLDINDFLAASAQYGAQDTAFAQADELLSGRHRLAEEAAFENMAAAMAQQVRMSGLSVDDFAAFQQAQGPSAADFAAFQQAQGPTAADFAAFQAAQGPTAADFAALQAVQKPSMADFSTFQAMQCPSIADFAAFQRAQGPSAADLSTFQATQGPSVADFEVFQAVQGPAVADFQAFQRSQGPSVTDFPAFQRQISATDHRVVSLTRSSSEKDWDAALADALTIESLGLADSKEPLATMCAADQIPAQLIFLEARLRLTQHLEGGMKPAAIHELLQTEIDRLVLMNCALRCFAGFLSPV
jgi:hypothetical protein